MSAACCLQMHSGLRLAGLLHGRPLRNTLSSAAARAAALHVAYRHISSPAAGANLPWRGHQGHRVRHQAGGAGAGCWLPHCASGGWPAGNCGRSLRAGEVFMGFDGVRLQVPGLFCQSGIPHLEARASKWKACKATPYRLTCSPYVPHVPTLCYSGLLPRHSQLGRPV